MNGEGNRVFERIQLSRRRGYRKPEGTVVVARPSGWGNPFRVNGRTVFGLPWGEIRDYPIGTKQEGAK